MSSIKDFKSIADEVMSEVTVSDKLKRETLQRCVKKRRPLLTVLIPATVSAAALIGVIAALTSLPGGGNELPGPLSAIETATPLMTGEEAQVTLEEAEVFFGEALIVPDYAPEGFSLSNISLSGEGEFAQVSLEYSNGETMYVVVEEKAQMIYGFEGYEAADINGTAGYVKSTDNEVLLDTEVHWMIGNVHYAVIGSIAEHEALKTARSMKQ